LIDPATGLTVQGYLAGEDGTIDPNAELTTIQLPLGGAAIVQATTEASLIGNLSADPDAPVTLVRNITVFDSLGNERDLLMTFTQQPQINWNGTDYNRWDWEAEYTNNETPPVTTSVGTGTVLFDEFGTYVAEGTVAGGTFTERPANDDEVSIPAAALGTSPTVPDTPFDFEIDFSLLTELAGESDVTISTQDGFPPGTLESFSVSRNGVINGIYTNGLSQVVGQVALATFANDQGLVRLGDNLFEHTSASGLPRIRPSGGAGSGEIIGGVLERSNVDLAAEFSDLIVTQRGFQANARTITTADTLLQEAVNLIR
jgi:flagellar hook protein FlgE